MADKNKEKAKKDMKMYQWLYFTPFSIIGAIGVIAVAIVAILIFVCSAKYLVVSFTLESAKIFPALVLTFIGLCVVAVLVFSEVILIKKYIKALKEFIEEKEEVSSDNSTH
ncbi:MAG: hypothetical protein K2K85_06020 [Clostridia bacterium]|nr:hypothetical protein [Clostridia bacterium]MDE6605556.1 hypothetical protein [Clostridia bacterium]